MRKFAKSLQPLPSSRRSEKYCQHSHPWNGGKVNTELQKISFIPKKNIKSWLTKQADWQVHIQNPKEKISSS